MEQTVRNYQACIKQVLREYALFNTDRSSVETIFDDEQMRYLAVRIGWHQETRIYLCLIHIDICQDQVIIQCNNTEYLIATELAERGIPREKIVLGFVPAIPVEPEQCSANFLPSKPENRRESSAYALAA